MVNKIQFKRGLAANRTGITPSEGEPLYDTDTKKTYIGDGSTAGGNLFSGGGGITAATVVVAASNALHPERADYQCDGVADNVEIQAALDIIGSLPYGGRLFLSDGTFSISNTLNVSSRTHVEGTGMTSTRLILANNANCNMFQNKTRDTPYNSHLYFSNLTLTGNRANQTSNGTLIDLLHTPNVRISNCVLYESNTCGLHTYGGYQIRVDHIICAYSNSYGVHIQQLENGFYLYDGSLEVNSGGNLKVESCILLRVQNMYFDYAMTNSHIEISDCHDAQIINNYIVNNCAQTVDYAIKLTNSFYSQITSNYIRRGSSGGNINTGIFVGDSQYININDNQCMHALKGIELDESATGTTNYCNINNNFLQGTSGSNVITIDIGIAYGSCMGNVLRIGDVYMYTSGAFKINSNQFLDIGSFDIGPYTQIKDCYGYDGIVDFGTF